MIYLAVLCCPRDDNRGRTCGRFGVRLNYSIQEYSDESTVRAFRIEFPGTLYHVTSQGNQPSPFSAVRTTLPALGPTAGFGHVLSVADRWLDPDDQSLPFAVGNIGAESEPGSAMAQHQLYAIFRPTAFYRGSELKCGLREERLNKHWEPHSEPEKRWPYTQSSKRGLRC